MNTGNGKASIIKVGNRGIRKFQYDDKTEVVEIDVLFVSNQWAELDHSFRDENGEVPPERRSDHLAAAVHFVSGMLRVEKMSATDAYHFLKLLHDEAEELKPFFVPKSVAERVSPSSSDITFST